MFVNKKELVQDTFKAQVSTEGIVAGALLGVLVVGAISTFLDKRKEAKKHPTDSNDITKLARHIKETYSNESWLKQQTIKTGNVSATDFSKHLQVDGKVPGDLSSHIEHVMKVAKGAVDRWVDEYTQYIKSLTALRRYLETTSKADYDKSKVTELIDSIVSPDDVKWTDSNESIKAITELPALTNQQILKYSKLVSRLIETAVTQEERVWDTIEDNAMHVALVLNKIPAYDRDGDAAHWNRVESCFGEGDVGNEYDNHFKNTFTDGSIKVCLSTARALAKYIDASIK